MSEPCRGVSRQKARASRNCWMRCVSPWRGNCSPSRIWRSAISPRLSPIPRILLSWMPCGGGAASCLRIGGARLDPFWARRKAIPHAIALAAADVRNGSTVSLGVASAERSHGLWEFPQLGVEPPCLSLVAMSQIDPGQPHIPRLSYAALSLPINHRCVGG